MQVKETQFSAQPEHVQYECNAITLQRRSGSQWRSGERFIQHVIQQWCEKCELPQPKYVHVVAFPNGFNAINIFFNDGLNSEESVLQTVCEFSCQLMYIAGRGVSMHPLAKDINGITNYLCQQKDSINTNYNLNVCVLILQEGQLFDADDHWINAVTRQPFFYDMFRPKTVKSVELQPRPMFQSSRILLTFNDPFENDVQLLEFLSMIGNVERSVSTLGLMGRRFSIEPLQSMVRIREE